MGALQLGQFVRTVDPAGGVFRPSLFGICLVFVTCPPPR
jgi:hypothetical protein